MPAFPEFFEGRGDVREVEIFIEVVTKQFSQTNGNERIPRKISEYLKGITEQHRNKRQGRFLFKKG